MQLSDFEIPLQPKVHGTSILSKTFDSPNLDFFVMLSSCSGVLGNSGQANYAAGNAFQDAFAVSNTASEAHYMSIALGPVKDIGILARDKRLEETLMRRGFVPMSIEDTLELVSYSISPQAKADQCHYVIAGFNRRSMSNSDGAYYLQLPLLSLLPSYPTIQSVLDSRTDSADLGKTLADIEDTDRAIDMVADSIRHKLSSLLGVEEGAINLRVPLAELGFDSLIAVELRNWLTRKFASALQTSEIPSASDSFALARKIVKRSKLIGPKEQDRTDVKEGFEPVNENDNPRSRQPPQFPKQPLPNFDETMQYFLALAGPISTEEEFITTRKAVEEFAKPAGLGRLLHQRLVDRFEDPSVENWMTDADLYLQHQFSIVRTPLVPYHNFFGSHYLSRAPHHPAERAAIICTAAYAYKRRLNEWSLAPMTINGQPLDPHMYEGLFNVCREPGMKTDQVKIYSGRDHIIVMRHGHLFKVQLTKNDQVFSYERLRATFSRILREAPEATSWLSILTADWRTPWAEVRFVLIHDSPIIAHNIVVA